VASGASGSKGRRNKRAGRADEIVALVGLRANDTLFVVVGQQGNAYCEVNGVSERDKERIGKSPLFADFFLLTTNLFDLRE